MKSIIHWIETRSLPNGVLYGITLVVFFAAPYLSRFGMDKAIALVLVWVVISGLFRKHQVPKQTSFGRADKIALYLLSAFLIIAFLDYQFHVIDRIYEFYVLHTLD
jgi:hypothetical protein